MSYLRLLQKNIESGKLKMHDLLLQIRGFLVTSINHIKGQFIWNPMHIFYVLVISFVCLLISNHIIILFNAIIVKPVLAKIYKNNLSTLEILLAFILFFSLISWSYNRIIKIKYKISLLTLYFPIVISCWYWIERFTENNYWLAVLIFHPVLIYQFDLPFAIVSFSVIGLVINLFSFTTHDKKLGILKQDVPLLNFSDDEFNRETYVTELIAELQNMDLMHDRSFTVGVNSSWGMGKTSILEAFKKEVSNSDGKICMEYNPWLSSHKDGLTYDFFVHLESTLSRYIETSSIISDYGAKLVEAEFEGNPLKFVSHLLYKDSSIKENFDNISRIIISLHRKLYVIVDDLDRLDNSEVMKVLQLIRNTANFPNIIFIVAYDKEYLVHALVKNRIYNAPKYLEKIFDLEIVLPIIEDIRIRESLRKTLMEGLSTIALTILEKQSYEDQLYKLIFSHAVNFNTTKFEMVGNTVLSIIKNKRDIIKFSNSFLLSLKLNKRLTYLPDLFILELIKYASSKDYGILSANDHYLDIITVDNVKKYQLHPSNNTEDYVFRGLPYDITTRIKGESLRKLIRALYIKNNVQDYQYDKAISITDNFYSYFLFTVPTANIDPNLIDDIIF